MIKKNTNKKKFRQNKNKDNRPILDENTIKDKRNIDYDKDKPPHWQSPYIIVIVIISIVKEDKIKEELRVLIKQGKEEGYILTSSLNNVISSYAVADQDYVKQSLVKMKIH